MGYKLSYPFNPAIDSNSAVMSDAFFQIYLNGTTTPVSLYSDAACTVSASNPIEADASGRFPQRWKTTSADYTIVFGDASDSEIETFDDVPVFLSGSGFLQVANDLSDVDDPATARANLELGDIAVIDKDTITEDTAPAAASDFLVGIDVSAGAIKKVKHTALRPTEVLLGGISVSDESTAITTGAAKVTFRCPYAFTITSVRASLGTVSSSGVVQIDINEAGVSIFSTPLTIDANEKTSTTAATAAVVSDTSLADDAEITIDIDSSGTGAAGLKLYIIGYRT